MQADCVTWFRNKYRAGGLNRLLWAVPNGGQRTDRDARVLKATGLLAGVWDLHLFYKGKLIIFELKVGKNQLTVDRIAPNGSKLYGQKEWGELMLANGATCFVIRSIEQFQAACIKVIGW